MPVPVETVTLLRASALLAGLISVGCASDDRPVNPSFPVTTARAVDILHFDVKHPRRLRRPLLVVGGFADPGWAPPRLRDRFRRWTGDARVADVTIGLDLSFADCRTDIVTAADRAFPTADADRTTEVDVIGISMGGLAARYAALPPGPRVPSRRRLRIGRLFTISSPLRGALLAEATPFDAHPLQPAMRPGSWLYRLLDDAPQSADDLYAVYSYVRLRDGTVGANYASVPGVTPWWVSTPPLQAPHDAAFGDPRILADIACRLRGEPPLADDPPSPFPADE